MSPPPLRLAVLMTFQSVAGPAPFRVQGVAGLGCLALSILINHTAHRCRRIPETAALYNSRHTVCGGTRQDISLPRRNKSPETPGKIELRFPCVAFSVFFIKILLLVPIGKLRKYIYLSIYVCVECGVTDIHN